MCCGYDKDKLIAAGVTVGQLIVVACLAINIFHGLLWSVGKCGIVHKSTNYSRFASSDAIT